MSNITLRCETCKALLPVSSFGRNTSRIYRGGVRAACRPCEAKRQKERRLRFRREVLAAYGGQCVCCGESRYEFLAVDHTEGNGNQDRRDNPHKCGSRFMNWLRSAGFPAGYRILCHNCNQAIGLYGYCPHQKPDTGSG